MSPLLHSKQLCMAKSLGHTLQVYMYSIGVKVITSRTWHIIHRTFLGWYWPSAVKSSVEMGSNMAMASSAGTIICDGVVRHELHIDAHMYDTI